MMGGGLYADDILGTTEDPCIKVFRGKWQGYGEDTEFEVDQERYPTPEEMPEIVKGTLDMQKYYDGQISLNPV